MRDQVTHAIVLHDSAEKAIRRHGRAAFPHECCGAMLGRDGAVRAVYPLPNATDQGPRRRFLVRPNDYRLAENEARSRNLDLLGFYHSHPDHPAVPSQYDLEHAWPSFSYLILSVADGAAADLRSWRLSDDRSQFEEESVVRHAPQTE